MVYQYITKIFHDLCKKPPTLNPLLQCLMYSPLRKNFRTGKLKYECIIILNKALHENEITSKSWEMSSG